MIPLLLLILLCVPINSPQKIDIVQAAKQGDLQQVKAILSQSPEKVRSVDESGYTSLHWASIREHWDVFQLLLEHMPDINAVGADGGTPVHWASHHDDADRIKLLLDAGGNIHIQNRWGRTPLHTAARRGCFRVARLLLDRGSKLDTVTHEGWTPLHVAYLSGHKKIIELLISRGAPTQVKDSEGKIPSELYSERPQPIPIDPKIHVDYIGEYQVDEDFAFKVWQESGHLYMLDFAKDELYPIAKDTFFCQQEPWKVVFTRNDKGEVKEIRVDFLRRSVVGSRLQ